MAINIFKVAIIGAGGISGAHSGAIMGSGGRVRLTAAIDPNRAAVQTLAAAHQGASAFSEVDEFLKAHKTGRIEADGVVICTPPSMRIGIIQACLKSGLHILSEKPIAHTLADARKLTALAKKHPKCGTFVAYCHRFVPAVQVMKSMVNAGEIGELVRYENTFACDLPGHKGKWFSDVKKSGGGALLDMGSHSIDLFHFIVGQSEVAGAVLNHSWKGRTETAGTVLLKSTTSATGVRNNQPGVAGSIISGWAETSRFSIALIGDEGMMSYDYQNPEILVLKDLDGKSEMHKVESHDVRFARQMIAFAAACQTGGKKGGSKASANASSKAAATLASFDDGLATAAAFDRAVELVK